MKPNAQADTLLAVIRYWLAPSLLLLACPLPADGTPTRPGSRAVTSQKQTASGAPVVHMWRAPMPESDTATGFPPAIGARHFTVWKSTVEDGPFNHQPALTHFDGVFFAMWSNHPQGEGAPGQRALFSISHDAGTWTEPRVLFPPPDNVKKRGDPGMSLCPDRWIVLGGALYAVAYTHGGADFPPIARAVRKDGSIGIPFVLRPVKDPGHLPLFMRNLPNATQPPPQASAILKWYRDTGTVSRWSHRDEGVPRWSVDNANLIEPFTYRAADGATVLMMRSHATPAGRKRGAVRPNNRIYVSFMDPDGKWTQPHPTDIPDSPSRAEALVLGNGTVLLVGNQIAPRFDSPKLYMPRHTLTASISADGYHFTKAFILRDKAPTRYRFKGVEGRTLGYGYPSSIIHNDHLYTLYSVGKEDIALTRVPLKSLGLSTAGNP